MKFARATIVATLCVSASLAPVHAQRGPTQEELNRANTSTEWLLPHHDYAGQRFVNLKQITPANASSLRPVCIYQAGDVTRFATNPLVYEGTLYFTTGVSTIALDATTCKQRWRYDWKAKGKETFPSNRGAAIKEGKIIRGTNDGYLIALDAASGQLLWDRHISEPEKFEQIGTAPLVYEDLIIMGVGVSELGVKGWLGAFRLDNGEPVWRFNTVPDEGEFGADSWGNAEARERGGGAVWMPPSLDTATGLIYVPVGNPSPFMFGTVRPGANLYTNAMLVLDAKTGTLQWYKQFTPHDTHDWDVAVTSPLFVAEDKGTHRRLVTIAGKDGLLRVMNRDSHDELYSVAITTRSNEDVEPTVEGVRTCPGASGGALWSTPALNPIENMMFVASIDWCGVFKKADELRFVPGQMYRGGTYIPDPLEKSHGWLTAIDAGTGSVRWKYESPRPLLAAVTATAGGVLFTGELTGDFLAIDSKDGKVLYRFYAGGPITGGVISYAVKGKQYVAVASGVATGYWQAPGGAATMLVFSLP